MLHLRLEQFVPASADVVWPLVTEPDRMSLWSTVPIEPLAPGDGGTYGGVGALRRITPRGMLRRLSVRETVIAARAPRWYAYRMVGGPARWHRGEIELHPDRGGVTLTWSVDADLIVPGTWLIEMLLHWQLSKSLRNLARIAPVWEEHPARRRRRPHASPAGVIVSDPDEVRALYERATAVLAAQRSLQATLRAAGDPKHWFMLVYAHVTQGEIDACRKGVLEHPDWSLRVVPDFWDFYVQNFARWRGVIPGEPEAHWAQAFAMQEDGGDNRAGILAGVREGAWAHIERDLPRSLARVYREHYAGRCDYARFRADYLALGQQARVFRHASDVALRDLGGPPGWLTTAAMALLPPAARDALQEHSFYPVHARRLDAFEAGGRIVAAAGGRARALEDMTRIRSPRARGRRPDHERQEISQSPRVARAHGGARH